MENENDFDADFDFDFDADFEESFARSQQAKWFNETYIDHCAGCPGEDCPCCQYNPNL